uniref:Uncharacterized protein n=1 Tax=Anopheles christyi TaxID=43041 RepID=A0A182KIN5_9DIPT
MDRSSCIAKEIVLRVGCFPFSYLLHALFAFIGTSYTPRTEEVFKLCVASQIAFPVPLCYVDR